LPGPRIRFLFLRRSCRPRLRHHRSARRFAKIVFARIALVKIVLVKLLVKIGPSFLGHRFWD
jgi:hypothetical protein